MHFAPGSYARRLAPIHKPPSPEDGLAVRERVDVDLPLNVFLVFAEPTRWPDGLKGQCVGIACSPWRQAGNIFAVSSPVRFAYGALSDNCVQPFPSQRTLEREWLDREPHCCVLRQPIGSAKTADREPVCALDHGVLRDRVQRWPTSRRSVCEYPACVQSKHRSIPVRTTLVRV